MVADEATHHLLRSLKEEREYVLMPRLKRLEEALGQIGAFAQASAGKPQKNEALLHIAELAEAALRL